MVFLCSFFIGIRSYLYINNFSADQLVITNERINIQVDTVKIDGNFLEFYGQIDGKMYLIYYTLTSENEKLNWSNQAPPDYAIISGKTENFSPARNLNGFDEQKYYHSIGISQSLQADSLRPVDSRKYSLSRLRHRLIDRIDQRYSDHLASYIKALVIGYKDLQFDEYMDGYKANGLLHLFTLSGLHIQFYLGGLHVLLKRLRLVRASRLGILCLVSLFVIPLTGGSYSTIRAVFSFLIAFSCLTFDVALSKLDQWSIMLFLLVSCFPLALWSVGAQLSVFFSMILLYMTDLELKQWQHSLMFTFLALPILIYSFSEWSILGGVLTLLLFPLFEWVILPSCLLLFAGCFLPGIHYFSNLFDECLRLLEWFLIKFSLPNLIIGKPSIFIFLCLSILVLTLLDRIKYQRTYYFLILLAVGLLFSISYSFRGIVAFVDVGQGDCLFIRLPFKQETFLIDTGGRLRFGQELWKQRQSKALSDYNILPFLRSIGCQKIDHLIVTHNDEDHMGELENILANVRVKNLYLGTGSQMELRELLEPLKGTAVHLVKQGDQVGQKLKLSILSPQKSTGENNDSLVTYFEINQQRFLITGDLEITGEEKLIQDYPNLRVDFLKVGHHGSNTSTSEQFLAMMDPKYAIISVGRNNRYGHPTPETLEKLASRKIYTLRTDQNGMVYYQWSPITKRGKLKLLIDFPR